MLGKIPKGVKPPDLESYQRIKIINCPEISQLFCTQPDGSYLVESVLFNDKEYHVMVRKPDSKKIKDVISNCSNQKDFTIWVVESDGRYWMPLHLRTLEAYSKLKSRERKVIYSAIEDVIIHYVEPVDAAQKYRCMSLMIDNYPAILVLSYLKWMAVLEDTLFPPPKYLGRRMAFAGYVLVHSGVYHPKELQRVLRVFAR